MKPHQKKPHKAAARARTKPAGGIVRLAIVGTGGMAGNHARQFSAMPNVRMVAACDIDADRVNGFCQQHGIAKAYTDVGTLLKESDCNAVTVVTPDAAHAEVSIQCLKAGRHVLCEKPLARNEAQAKRMVAAARRADRVAMVNFSYRGWSCIQAVRTLVAEGGIGDKPPVPENSGHSGNRGN